MTEDEIVRWHHRLDKHESEQAPGIGDGYLILLIVKVQLKILLKGFEGLRNLETWNWIPK